MEENNLSVLDKVEKTLNTLIMAESFWMRDYREEYKIIPYCLIERTDNTPVDLTFLSLLKERLDNYSEENKGLFLKIVTSYNDSLRIFPIYDLEKSQTKVDGSFGVDEICDSTSFCVDLCMDILKQNGKYPDETESMDLMYFERVLKTSLLMYELIVIVYKRNGEPTSTYTKNDITHFLNKLSLNELIFMKSYINVKSEYSDKLKNNDNVKKVVATIDELISKKKERENRLSIFTRKRK